MSDYCQSISTDALLRILCRIVVNRALSYKYIMEFLMHLNNYHVNKYLINLFTIHNIEISVYLENCRVFMTILISRYLFIKWKKII